MMVANNGFEQQLETAKRLYLLGQKKLRAKLFLAAQQNFAAIYLLFKGVHGPISNKYTSEALAKVAECQLRQGSYRNCVTTCTVLLATLKHQDQRLQHTVRVFAVLALAALGAFGCSSSTQATGALESQSVVIASLVKSIAAYKSQHGPEPQPCNQQPTQLVNLANFLGNVKHKTTTWKHRLAGNFDSRSGDTSMSNTAFEEDCHSSSHSSHSPAPHGQRIPVHVSTENIRLVKRKQSDHSLQTDTSSKVSSSYFYTSDSDTSCSVASWVGKKKQKMH